MKPLAQNTMIQGRYLIVQLIGKGGMGEVYLAVDQRLGSAVALKRTFFAGDEMLGNAFEREARILARMRHPVLPKVSDHFGEGEEQYLVMEHISGDDLSKRLEVAQKPFPLSWVMFWADQLLDALSYLHSHEPPIIHRDIKPQNLKLTDENHIILLDFGLSKSSTGNTLINQGSGETSGSTSGSVVGYTPHYAPMEQIRGIGTSPRSDLYSLSATLYQLMTNSVPVDALTRADDLINISSDPIKPLYEINQEIPKPVSDVILKGMEISQEKRFGSAKEMQKALRKAYASMQEAMTANTVAFSAVAADVVEEAPIAANLDKTEIMDFGLLAESANEVSIPTNVSQTPAAPVDFDATVAFDANAMDSGPRQADVKTEVFIPGSAGFPSEVPETPATPEQPAPGTEAWSLTNVGNEAFQTDAVQPGSEAESFSPDATMPIVAFDGQSTDTPSEAPNSEFLTTPGAFDATPQAEAEMYPDGPGEEQAAAASAGVAGTTPTAAAPAKKKGSAGKIVAIFGGLFLFFVVALGAIGGGWYYYNNYYMAGPAVEPTPTPEPTPEPTPDQTPDLDVGIDGNTNTTDPVESDTPVEQEPTPPLEQDSTTPVTRPTATPRTRPTITPRTTPARTTPTPRPTPQPTRTGPRILQ